MISRITRHIAQELGHGIGYFASSIARLKASRSV
jgi:hypothetical protein